MTGSALAFGLVGALTLVALNGFFVAVEFVVVAVRRTRIERLASTGHGGARLVLKLIDHPDRAIAASQLGITMASLALGWIGESTVAALIEPLLEHLVGRWSEAAAHSIGTVVAFALVTFTHIVVGEQVPKTIAIRYAESVSLTVSRPMDWFIRIFRPLIAFLDGATAAILRLLRMEPLTGHRTIYTPDELRLIVRESQEGGAIEAEQEELLQNVILFGDRQVREAMIPRPDVIGIEAEATVRDLLGLFADHSHARFPVYRQDLDDVVGIVAIKDVLRFLAQNPDGGSDSVGPLIRPAVAVPETAPIVRLLGDMQAAHTQMAIVLDEYGGTAGIVTLEGLVEEIVGTLSDELVAEEEQIVILDERTVEIDAQMRIDEVNDELGLALPEHENYETVAGFILEWLQRIPEEGDALRHGHLQLQVIRMKGPKIEKVRIQKLNDALT
jgi:putative hemolysin